MKLKYAVIVLAILWCYLLFDSIVGLAMSVDYRQEKENPRYVMRATAYCLNGTTATNTHTRPGICAGRPEWFGKEVSVFEADNDGVVTDFIGVFKVEDTGGEPIRNGRVLDIWLPTYEECMLFGNKKVVVYLLEGGE